MSYFDNGPYLAQFDPPLVTSLSALPTVSTTPSAESSTPVLLCVLAGTIVIAVAALISCQQLLLREQEARTACLNRTNRTHPSV